MSPLTPYLAAGALVACIGSFGGGIWVGKGLAENGYFKAEAKATEQAEDRTRIAQQNDSAAAERGVLRETTFREIIREVPKIIERPGYGVPCIDDAGVQQIRRAVEAANGRAPGGGAAGNAGGIQPAPGDP